MVQWAVAPFVHDGGSVQSQHPSASPCTEQTQAIHPAQEPFLSHIGYAPPPQIPRVKRVLLYGSNVLMIPYKCRKNKQEEKLGHHDFC